MNEIFGCRLDKFAIAGFNGDPLPNDPDGIELRAYEIGRARAGLHSAVLSRTKTVEQRSRESFKTLGIVGA